MNAFQFDLLSTPTENHKAAQAHDLGLVLPVSPLQTKHATETPTLTERELEIMHMTLSGKMIPQIAIKLPLSIAGVKWRLGHIYDKFGVQNRLELIEKAVVKGLQFRTAAGILHTFHVRIVLRDQSTNTDNEVSQ